MPAYRIGVDTGGTFSDFCVFNQETGELLTTKVLSTPRDPAQSVVNGLKEIFSGKVKPEEVISFAYSTTVGTNALLEGKVEKTGVLLTAGLTGINDIYEGAASTLNKYDPYCFRSKSLVPRRLCQGVDERVDFNGAIVKPLDSSQAAGAIDRLLEQDVKSIAVCLLFSFLNPRHENELEALIRQKAPGCQVSLSSEVLPQIREYSRLSTTVVNAMIGPVLSRFLTRLGTQLNEIGITSKQLYIMQSNGGVRTFQAASATAVPLLLSGPAAGLIGANQLAGAAGYKKVITMDMGGTSCDIGLIEDGSPLISKSGAVDKYDIAVPMLDINTIGAGGGTIASVDKQGILAVGPASAGAAPGPVCYDTGGKEPTVTDANLVLGFLNPDYYLGGAMRLNKEMAEKAVYEKIARPLDLDLLEAAHGIVEIVNANMEQGIRAISTERGYDVRDFVLLVFGGAGGLHASRLAEALKTPTVLVPLFSAVTSAMGLLLSDVKHDYMRSRLDRLGSVDIGQLNERFAELRKKAYSDLTGEGFAPEQIVYAQFLDLRYSGQGYELTIPVPGRTLAAGDKTVIEASFHNSHQKQFGHKAEKQTIEIVNYRVSATVKVAKPIISRFPRATTTVNSCLKGTRKVYLGKRQGLVDFAVYDREKLYPGHVVRGPAIVEQKDSTTAIFPGQTARIDDFRNIIISTASTNEEDHDN